ncbi:NADH-quinone oxidoreductase subunit N [Lujinxingia vulgaris]|uniref:NADH-quinone oxidoreductase subunit N n=1 Tax=Lujinxingia vulgaris TaxID=2600176 RepID=A0A5C6XJC7_9DELT|nr:NADH-quinone oxidoreductase subunit N [Lujinxingia vulgaris]TXD43742.1 NADH-quinone oxidoreductase subunit N [Lujinxingia vulgaris]
MTMQLLSTLNTLAMLTPPQGAEFAAIVPGMIVTLVALAFILIDVFHRKGTPRDYLAYFSVIGLGVGAASSWYLWDGTLEAPTFFGMLYLDRFALFFSALACVSGALAILCSPAVLRSHRMDRGEYYLLVLFSVVGMIFMAASADLLSLFIAFEIMSIPIYVLAGFLREDSRSAEASMKYFVLGAFSAALMLYGIALIYGATGTTNLEMIAQNLYYLEGGEGQHAGFGLAMLGVLLIFSGFAFKVAAVPFHIWTPDVYTGSPTPVVGFMATAVKAIAFAGLLRVFVVAFPLDVLRGGFFGYGWIDIAFALAAFSMVLGNVVALLQNNVKRMLAYSSIAHAGYLLLGFTAANAHPRFFLHNDAILFYLVAYTFGTIGSFAVLSYFSRRGESVETFEDLGQLGIKYPMMGLVMGISIFSAAGIPPTAGFLGKFYIFRSAIDVGMQTDEFSFIGLAILGVLSSVAGVYYYLKVLIYMYMKPEKRAFRPLEHTGPKVAMVVCAVMTLYLGIFPARAIEITQESIIDFQGVSSAVQATLDLGQQALEARQAAE